MFYVKDFGSEMTGSKTIATPISCFFSDLFAYFGWDVWA